MFSLKNYKVALGGNFGVKKRVKNTLFFRGPFLGVLPAVSRLKGGSEMGQKMTKNRSVFRELFRNGAYGQPESRFKNPEKSGKPTPYF